MQTEEKVLKDATLVLLMPKKDKVLLSLKLEKIGEGCWNGAGGGIEDDDPSPEARAIIELEEEFGVIASKLHLHKRAVVYFHNTYLDGTTSVCKMHVYVTSVWVGKPHETETHTMSDPLEFSIDELPDELMPADKFWLPHVLRGETIIADAWYGPFQQYLLRDVEIRPATKEELYL